MEFAQTLQNTAFARWIGESGSLLGYPLFLFVHTLGLAVLAGLSAGINLRLLGLAPGLRLAPMVRFYPAMWFAFLLTVISGTALLVADATTKLSQTVFYVKLLFVLLAVVNLQLIRRRVFNDPALDEHPIGANAKLLAATSLFFWMAATTAGRLIAYIY